MSFDVLGDLNWLAVLAAWGAYFLLGGFWFAKPVLGEAWSHASGIEIPEDESAGATYYVVPLITCALAAVAVAMLAEATASTTLGSGIVLGLVVGIGIAAGVTILSGAFDRKPDPVAFVAIVGGYHVIGLLIVGIIVGAWG